MKHKNDVVRSKWNRENFNAACNSLKWLKENGSDEERRKDASHILDKMIEYSFVYWDCGEWDGDIIRTAMFQAEHDMLMYLLGAASVCDAANDDFYDIARKKIWKWKVAKDAAWEQDKQAVREYLENHRGEKIIKKRIAETLDMPYYRCLDICGALKEEFVPGL